LARRAVFRAGEQLRGHQSSAGPDFGPHDRTQEYAVRAQGKWVPAPSTWTSCAPTSRPASVRLPVLRLRRDHPSPSVCKPMSCSTEVQKGRRSLRSSGSLA
jgi:hypothetical protein